MTRYYVLKSEIEYANKHLQKLLKVEISGCTDAWGQMFCAFKFSEYSELSNIENLVFEAVDCTDNLTDELRLMSENGKAKISVTTVYAANLSDKAVLLEFVKNAKPDFDDSEKLGEVLIEGETESLTLGVFNGISNGQNPLCAKVFVGANCSDGLTEKTELLRDKLDCPTLAMPHFEDAYFTVSVKGDCNVECHNEAVYESDNVNLNFDLSDNFSMLFNADVRKACVLELSSKSVSKSRELQRRFKSLVKGYAAFSNDSFVQNDCVKFDVLAKKFIFAANCAYGSHYNTVLTAEEAVFEGAKFDDLTVFAPSKENEFLTMATLKHSVHSKNSAAALGEAVSNKLSGGSKLYLCHFSRDEKSRIDGHKFGQVLSRISSEISKGKIYGARAVIGGGAAISAILSAAEVGKGIYFKNTSAELFKPFIGDVVYRADEKVIADSVAIAEIIDNPKVLFGDDELPLEIVGAAYDLGWKKVFAAPSGRSGFAKTEGFGFSNRSVFCGKQAKAKVVIPYFGNENSISDLADGFLKAKGKVETLGLSASDGKELNQSLKSFAKSISSAQILAFSSDKLTTLFLNDRVREATFEFLDRGGLILGIGGGMIALTKSGLLPYEKLILPQKNAVKIMPNLANRAVEEMVKVKISGNLSPWFNLEVVGDVYDAVLSESTGRIEIDAASYDSLVADGLIATQFVDRNGFAVTDYPQNPTGSFNAVEGLTSKCGRILGRLCHVPTDACGLNVKAETKLYEAGIKYFK